MVAAAENAGQWEVSIMRGKIFALLAAMGVSALVALGASAGGGDKADGKDPGVAHNDTRQLAMAFDLIELGRATRAPDLLISAARILRRIEPRPGEVTPEVSGGKDEGGVKLDLKAKANELLTEAVAMSPDNATIASMAKLAREERLVVPPAESGKRGTFGGPRS
jgi:hypothetical protein